MASSESGVNLIKKKVATLKSELDDCQNRANEAEEQLAEKETIIEKVLPLLLLFLFISSMSMIFFARPFVMCQLFCLSANEIEVVVVGSPNLKNVDTN